MTVVKRLTFQSTTLLETMMKMKTIKRMRKQKREGIVVKGLAVEVARETVTMEGGGDVHLARDPALRDLEGAVRGPVPPRGAERDAPPAQEAGRGIAQGHLAEGGGHADPVPEAVQGPVPVLETVTEIKAEGEGQGAGHMTDHVIAGERDPVPDQRKEGGATVLVPAHVTVTGIGEFGSSCREKVLTTAAELLEW